MSGIREAPVPEWGVDSGEDHEGSESPHQDSSEEPFDPFRQCLDLLLHAALDEKNTETNILQV